MIKKIFNTTFENALRLNILLDVFAMPEKLEKLYVVDFMAQYGAAFEISDNNLNGDNPYMFSEFTARRETTKDALKYLVLHGMVQALNLSDGIGYAITPEGEENCKLLDSEYAVEYRRTAEKAVEKIFGKSNRELINSVYQLSN